VGTVSGSGFAANETVTLSFDANPTDSTKAQATASGLLPTTRFTVPASADAGVHSIAPIGATRGYTAAASPTVATTTLTVAPGANTRGSTISVSGNGFASNEAGELTIHGVPIPLATLHTVAADPTHHSLRGHGRRAHPHGARHTQRKDGRCLSPSLQLHRHAI